jgi:hypothetical protein
MTRDIAGPAYDMPTPNAGLPYKGGLKELCDEPRAEGHLPPWAFATETYDTWISPDLLEAALDGDLALRREFDRLAEAGASGPTASAERHVGRIFEDVILPDVIARFDAIRPLVAQYCLAKAAARRQHPKRFPEPEAER